MTLRDVLRTADDWTQGAAAIDAYGEVVDPLDSRAVAFDLIGACIVVYGNRYLQAVNLLEGCIDSYEQIASRFNDYLSTNFSKVCDLIEAAGLDQPDALNRCNQQQRRRVMGIAAKAKGGNFTPAPADVHNAICIGVYDLGTQNTNFGKKQQIMLLWELDCQQDNGKNYVVSRTYGLSIHAKAEFRKVVESWAGRKLTQAEEENGFDAAKLLGQPCALQVIHNDSGGNTYANVGSVTKLMKGTQPMKPQNTPISFSFEDNGKNLPAGIPQWVAKKISQSDEWNGVVEDDTPDSNQQFDAGSVKEQAVGVF